MTDSAENNPSLVRLSDADYEVAPGEPDVRGWDVVLTGDETVGEVDDLIIDPAAGKVRYLEVELDGDALGLDRDRHVLVPIETAQLDADEEQVVLSGMGRDALLKVPEYDGSIAASGYDHTFRSHLSEDQKSNRITRSAEELRIGKRTAQTGEVRVSKHVETERVSQTVPLRGEEVYIERRPVERAVGSAVEMHDDEIVVPIVEEEPVVEKRAVVREEIVIRKEPTMTERAVEADVRREVVDIQPSSDNVHVKDDLRGRGGE